MGGHVSDYSLAYQLIQSLGADRFEDLMNDNDRFISEVVLDLNNWRDA